MNKVIKAKVWSLYFAPLLFLFVSCSEDVLPKPKAFLRLDYPIATYQKTTSTCPYSIEISQEAIINFKNNCWAEIQYPNMNAIVHLTYREIDNDLNSVLQEVERLTYEHTIKADAIKTPKLYSNDFKKVYGQMISIEGNVASNIQFYVTDSIKNVLFGVLYFNVKPNYDSLLPAINYIEKDIKNLIESIEWSNN